MDEKKEIYMEDIISSFVGSDDDGDPKAVVEASLIRFHKHEDKDEDPDIEELTCFTSLDSTVARFSRFHDFLLMEIHFDWSGRIWMNRFQEVFDQYHAIPDKEDFELIVSVRDLEGMIPYVLTMSGPLICGKFDEASTLQMVFPLQTALLVENTVNMQEIIAEVNRELEEEACLQEAMYGEDEEEEAPGIDSDYGDGDDFEKIFSDSQDGIRDSTEQERMIGNTRFYDE